MITPPSNFSASDLLGRTLIGPLEQKSGLHEPNESPVRLKNLAKQIESAFIFELLKEMRQTTKGGLLGKGLGSEVYGSLFDMELSRLFAERGLGLGDLVFRQLNRKIGENSENQDDPSFVPSRKEDSRPVSESSSPTASPKALHIP